MIRVSVLFAIGPFLCTGSLASGVIEDPKYFHYGEHTSNNCLQRNSIGEKNLTAEKTNCPDIFREINNKHFKVCNTN